MPKYLLFCHTKYYFSQSCKRIACGWSIYRTQLLLLKANSLLKYGGAFNIINCSSQQSIMSFLRCVVVFVYESAAT